MKKLHIICMLMILVLMLTACSTAQKNEDRLLMEQAIKIALSDDGIEVDGKPAANDPQSAVYVANDIIYYEEGKDFNYGEGTEADAHSAQDAAAHTVVHITKPGIYSLSGVLSRGQVAVDLGEDAKEDAEAVVTLILNGADITCEVAPAVIFYNVYECGSADAETATKDVDTAEAGANVLIRDGTVNNIRGAYVARIYKPDSVELSEDGTEVTDAKKLHKYDGAFYSRMSMNVNGGTKGTGELNIYAENEGLDSEMHLTVNGGRIRIESGNDGINTNEDGVSVTTINGGDVFIRVTGTTGEGDGIDSNGWLVINGGTLRAEACSDSADAGIDSDMGIHLNGGTVLATGHMLDHIEEGGQTYAVFNFAQLQDGNGVVTLKSEDGDELFEHAQGNAYSVMVYSSPELTEGTYSLLRNGEALSGRASFGGGMQGMPGGMQPPELPDGMEMPDFGDKQPPFEGMEMPENGERPEPPEKPQDGTEPGGKPEMGGMRGPGQMVGELSEASEVFMIASGSNLFSNIE